MFHIWGFCSKKEKKERREGRKGGISRLDVLGSPVPRGGPQGAGRAGATQSQPLFMTPPPASLLSGPQFLSPEVEWEGVGLTGF